MPYVASIGLYFVPVYERFRKGFLLFRPAKMLNLQHILKSSGHRFTI